MGPDGGAKLDSRKRPATVSDVNGDQEMQDGAMKKGWETATLSEEFRVIPKTLQLCHIDHKHAHERPPHIIDITTHTTTCWPHTLKSSVMIVSPYPLSPRSLPTQGLQGACYPPQGHRPSIRPLSNPTAILHQLNAGAAGCSRDTPRTRDGQMADGSERGSPGCDWPANGGEGYFGR